MARKTAVLRTSPGGPWALGLACALASVLCGCSRCSADGPEESAKDEASAEPAPPVVPSARPLGHRGLVGPEQLILPGQGVTAILFGATVPTIERHMQAPCEIKTESRCVYVQQAIEFTLEGGSMVRAKAYRLDRLVPGYPDQAFGTFHGGMRPNILFGLHRHIVHEEFGKPERSEVVESGAGPGLVARDFYPGVILEYDKIENGNTVLSAMEVFPADVPSAHRASDEPAGTVAQDD